MSKLYRSREGNLTAIDTKTQLTTLASESAPGPLLVPASAKMLKAIIACAVSDLGIAADCAIIARLEGPGLPEGPEVIAIGAAGVQVLTGGNGQVVAERFELDIPVTVANEILVFAEQTGEDMQTINVGITLEFVT